MPVFSGLNEWEIPLFNLLSSTAYLRPKHEVDCRTCCTDIAIRNSTSREVYEHLRLHWGRVDNSHRWQQWKSDVLLYAISENSVVAMYHWMFLTFINMGGSLSVKILLWSLHRAKTQANYVCNYFWRIPIYQPILPHIYILPQRYGQAEEWLLLS